MDQATTAAGIDWSKSGAPGSPDRITAATATNLVLQMACQGMIEHGNFTAARATADLLPEPGSGTATSGGTPSPSATRSQVLAQIALALAQSGSVAEAQAALDAAAEKSTPLLSAIQTEIALRNEEWASASNQVRVIPDPYIRALEFVRLATMETRKDRTNEALATLARAVEGASSAPLSSQSQGPYNLDRQATILSRIARQQQSAGDPAAAQRTLEIATKLVSEDSKPSKSNAQMNTVLSAAGALRLVAQSQGELGLWQEARSMLRRADDTVRAANPRMSRSSTSGPTSSLYLLARAAAKAGHETLARQWAGEETDPLAKARILLGIAEGLLDQDI